MNAIEQVLSGARCFKGLGEDPPHQNRSQIVNWFLKFCGLEPGYPWCAAYLSYVGWYALSDDEGKTSKWPIPVTAGCQVLHDNAKPHDIIKGPGEGQRGDIFLLWFPNLDGGRFGHTGFILSSLGNNEYITIEGNTSVNGSREGWCVDVRRRKLKDTDRLVRWSALLK